MVSSGVIIKRKKNYLKPLLFLIIIFIILFIISFLGHLVFSSFDEPENIIVLNNPLESLIENLNKEFSLSGDNITKEDLINRAEQEFNETYVNYILYALGAGNLHDTPLSQNHPKILFIMGEEVYNSNILNHEIFTEKQYLENPDIKVITTKREVILGLLSADLNNYMKESVSSGVTQIEMTASLTTLISKGYIKMYEELTGEKFIG